MALIPKRRGGDIGRRRGGGNFGGGGYQILAVAAIAAMMQFKNCYKPPKPEFESPKYVIHHPGSPLPEALKPLDNRVKPWSEITNLTENITERVPTKKNPIVSVSLNTKRKLGFEEFFEKYNETIEKCKVITDICFNGKDAEFSVKCDDKEITYSTDEIVKIRGQIGEQVREYSFKDVHQEETDSISEYKLPSIDTVSPVQFVQAIKYVKSKQNEIECNAKIVLCFSKKRPYGKLNYDCLKLNFSTTTNGSLSLSGKTKDGRVAEINIFNTIE